MDTEHAVPVLAALGHNIRLKVWQTLMPHGPLGLPAGSLAAQLAAVPSSLSFHLQQMTQAGLLVQRRSSRQIIYAVNNVVVDALCMFLMNTMEQVIKTPIALDSLNQSGDVAGKR